MKKYPRIVCFPFVGDEIGGSHFSATRLIEALDPARFRPLVVLHVSDGPVAAHLAERGIPFVAAPCGALRSRGEVGDRTAAATRSLLAFALGNAMPLARFLRSQGVDIVHSNDGRMHLAWALPAKMAGARHIWHHRGDPDAWGINYIAPFCASKIVTVSRFAVPRRPLLPVVRRLAVVHSPFEMTPASKTDAAGLTRLRDELGCSAETRFLAYFGLLITRKRPLGFVDIVAAFVRRHPELPVMGLIFGVPGAEEADLDRQVMQRAAELGIADRIRLMGFRRPVEPWMQAVDVLLVPAVREPFGRTLIEAMMLDVPVVATDDGGNPEAIENDKTGFLVPADCPDAFVEPVYRLLVDPACRKRITETAHRGITARYGLERHVAEIDRIYRDLAHAA